ncbi:MAG: heavy-metal-associated domain-containing protein [Rhizobiaceae bacterium]
MNSYTISGMTCGGCRAKVERSLKALTPEATVTLDPPVATLSNSVSLASVNEVLRSVGNYAASEINSAPLLAKAPGALNAWLATYYPLLLIMSLIALASFAGQSWMMSFMAGFFLVFGAFKLLDVPAFARSYAQYDLIAMNFRPWGYAYPFIEVALGFAFLFWFQMLAATWIALILSLVGAAGVIRSVMRRETIQCACLGTVFNLPMSTVTIVENLGMATMAIWMLIAGM